MKGQAMENKQIDAAPEAAGGAELADAQLEGVSGGAGWHWYCPECGSTNLKTWKQVPDRFFECQDCGYFWENW